ncbi:fungal transcriptional regulatory protein [Sporothrix brasiliensis 5110]|uniref:Fungal transcriptional regulatory protein n=1 Tax=Sporothrix brasiliensis 5110 TaxID=1398154 RepID=A0A0C2F107_9PEZI|nr:fungal transcriptional regulatory protein [Sporothrix brasiliensis 5110]KIH92534.1 fungal transcriptional regulatory protein [Sporothrix brasiliensis 5110]
MQTTGFRACELCRALKVRCMPADDAAGSSGGSSSPQGSSTGPVALPPVSERPACRRCKDTGSTCVYTEPRRTKRKRTDVRVRELEREVRMLSELLMLRRRVAEEGMPVSEYEQAQTSARASLAAAAATAMPPPAQQSLPDTPSALFTTPTPLSTSTNTPHSGTHQAPQPPAAAARTTTTPTSASTTRAGTAATDNMALHSQPQPLVADPVAAGILSMEKAVRLFRRYVTVMAPQRPFVVFPKVTLSGEMEFTPAVEASISMVATLVREHTPVLFLSILTAALGTGADDDSTDGSTDGSAHNLNDNSSGGQEDVATLLDSLLLRVYADRIIYQSEKSLELVQALLISSNWNFYSFERPTSNCLIHATAEAAVNQSTDQNGSNPTVSGFDNLRFYQHLHMAATMAVEIESEYHEKGRVRTGRTGGGVVSGLLEDPLAFERTLLACYMCCSSISLGFHRQTMLSYTPVMAGYLRRLEASPHAAPTDPVTVAWVHLQRTVDTSAGVLGLRAVVRNGSGAATLADSSATHGYDAVPDLADPNFQARLMNVTRQLEQWRVDHSRCLTSTSALVFEPVNIPPYRVSIPGTFEDMPARKPMTQAHLTSRRICLMASRSLIGIFLASPTEQLLGSPVVVYARVGYAVLVLLKLQISAALPGGAMHGLLLDTVTGDSATQIYQYLESLIARLEELEALGGRIASVWIAMVRIIHTWYEAYFVPAASGRPAESNSNVNPVLEPLRYCVQSSQVQPPYTITPEILKHSELHRDRRKHDPYSVTDEGFASLVNGIGTSVCGMLSTMSPSEEEAFLSSALDTGEIDRWMDPRIGLGDIQNRLFEFSAM